MSESTTMRANSSRTRKSIPLIHSLHFNKAKHSEDWHQTIDAIAGVLQPADPKFPYPQLRQATDSYIKKKGRVTQANVDVRLAILINAHNLKHTAVAAAAYAMTATSLRATLHVNLNVAYGSYWGLQTWLQSLIAANYGNPASITDLEATWARYLLPFATHGSGAAEKILIGVSRALRECATPNMNTVPDFLCLTSRALTDYAAHLEGLRLKNNWITAHASSCWMAELGRTSPAITPPGFLLPEHLLDAQFPVWRVWASWRPDLRLIRILSSIDGHSAAILSDLLALAGPDFISGAKPTMREGLIEQYKSGKSLVKLGGLIIEVNNRTRDSLREVLESIMSTLESISTALPSANRLELMKCFTELTIARPVTQEALNLVQALLFISKGTAGGLKPNIMSAVLHTYTERQNIGGNHIQELQETIQLFDNDRASILRRILLTPALLKSIIRCVRESQAVVRTLMDQDEPWTELALELHTFCSVLKSSRRVPVVGEKIIEQICILLPPAEHISAAIDVWTIARSQRTKMPSNLTLTDELADKDKHIDGSSQRFTAPSLPLGRRKESKHHFEEVVEQYFLHRLLSQQAVSYSSQRTFDLILKIWEDTQTPQVAQDRQLLAIILANITTGDDSLLIKCLNEIASTDEQLGPGLALGDLLEILQGIDENLEPTLVQLIRLLASSSATRDSTTQVICWRDLAYHLLGQEIRFNVSQGRSLVDHSLRTMKVAEWLSFLADIQTVFALGPTLPSDEDAVPSILRPEWYDRRLKFTPYVETLTRLEQALGEDTDTIKCILYLDGAQSNTILAILHNLKLAEKRPVEPFLHKVIGLLSAQANNGPEVLNCVSVMVNASSRTVEACKKIWDAKHGYLCLPSLPTCNSEYISRGSDKNVVVTTSTSMSKAPLTVSLVSVSTPANSVTQKYDVPPSVVEVMVAGWLLDEKTAEDTKTAVYSIASLLEIPRNGCGISKDKLVEAAAFWQTVEDEIVQESKRLETLRRALKAKDPRGTTLLLQQIGVPDASELDEEMMKLPTEVMDMVERVGENEVEITFSLAAFTQLRRAAMGIPQAASTLLLQLSLNHNEDLPPSFCLHYDNDPHLETTEHKRYGCSAASETPTKQICTSLQTAFTWQLSRIVYLELRRGATGIAELCKYVRMCLPNLSRSCISCNTSHQTQAVQLRRSTPCSLDPFSCARLWYNLPLHVRIPEIRTDTFAVDMALSSVYAAAMTSKPELLPGCPIRNTEVVKSTLNSLPTMPVMRDAINLSSVLNSYSALAEKLISWAVVHHRGFLAAATGLLKIPNLSPGTHQFVLANASPKLENAFVSKIQWTKRETTVLFHGTSLDRLPAILAQGLRVCSGTSLQRTGAAHGKGIYLSDDPATSFHYSPASLSWKNSGLSNMRMLLGCELVGAGNRVSGNIHVVTDVESVMVRYILLFTREARMPIRGHIEPAMASGMKALRSGAV